MKFPLFALLLFLSMTSITAQELDMEALKERKENIKDDLKEWEMDIKEVMKEVNDLKKELKLLEDSLKVYPIWSKGVFGTVGFNFTRFQDWLSKNESSTTASTIGYTFNGFFNLEEKKYFWNNTLKLNQSWIRFDNKDIEEEENGFQVASDAFNYSSLWGVKISKKLAISTLADYRTALLQNRFNNPSTLDFGFGLTWKPAKDMVIAFHPLNYNAVFAEQNSRSSLGLKVLAEYSKKFFAGINWTTSFSGFRSYKDDDLNNWSWTNGLSKTFKGIGFGLDFSFKQNKQEALARSLETNPFQWYYIFGVSYKFK